MNIGYLVYSENHIYNYNMISKLYCNDNTNIQFNLYIKNINKQIIIFNGETKLFTLVIKDNLKIILDLEPKYLIDFIICLVNNINNIQISEFYFDKTKQINQIEPDDKIIYKYMDRGYYLTKYIGSENNKYIIDFNKKKIKVNRNTFKLLNIVKYYEKDILPIN